MPPERALYVIDQNFPWYVAPMPWGPGIEVVRLSDVDPSLTSDAEDWEILLELEHRGGVDGFLTNDANILRSAREMLALQHTSLALIATDGVGHDPLKATGLAMVHLADIAADTAVRPMTYLLSPTGKRSLSARRRFATAVAHQPRSPGEAVGQERAAMRQSIGQLRPHLLPLLERRRTGD
ncbi:MAG: hypothetical protein IT303_17395 [Dehalococcoidia bacterium]|nr:hypothetical protein [Dehalococcoidia bacterium]